VSREFYQPGSTKNARAGELAAIMRRSWDALHEWLDAAGLDISYLESRIPQRHNVEAMLKDGFANWKQAVYPL
jgi:hypothetical protein